MLLHLIVAAEEPLLRKNLCRLLRRSDTVIETVKNRRELRAKLMRRVCDLAMIDLGLLGEIAAAEIQRIKASAEAPSIVILSEKDDMDLRGALVAAGCEAVLNPRMSERKLLKAVEAILARRREILASILASRFEPAEPGLTDFAATSPAMVHFIRLLPRIARSNSSVLILGETGVGKERVAHILHGESGRKAGPFVAVHCGALPESLLESELFGHEQGAFTGATRSRRGCFELAHGGTIFLDEIGEMPLHLQSKLLRALESHEIRRVGGEATVAVDVRVLAATNRDLEQEVGSKQFRRDLYYRLNVVSLTVPPLRERVEDIPELVESYIQYLRGRIGGDVRRINKQALRMLCSYDWPGNVRELINIVERAMLLCEGSTITPSDLPEGIAVTVNRPAWYMSCEVGAGWLLEKPLKDARVKVVERFERDYLTALLARENGRVGKTAERAGIDVRTLFDKMKRYGMKKEDFRGGAADS